MTTVRRLYLALTLLMFGASFHPVQARWTSRGPLPPHAQHVSVSTGYYDIQGMSRADLLTQIASRGPVWGDRRWGGVTRWWVEWRFTFEQGLTGCGIRTVTTHVRISYILPRWREGNGAPDALRQSWRRYATALRRHEEGHGENGKRVGLRIGRAIQAMGERPTCDALTREANIIGHSIIRSDTSDRDYDRATGHGATQGALLR